MVRFTIHIKCGECVKTIDFTQNYLLDIYFDLFLLLMIIKTN